MSLNTFEKDALCMFHKKQKKNRPEIKEMFERLASYTVSEDKTVFCLGDGYLFFGTYIWW